MPAIITSHMRTYAATEFMSGFADPSTKLYLFIGRTLPWVNENTPPTPVDCVNEQVNAFLDMLSLKKISGTDVSLVIPRNNWTAGTVYSQYINDIDLFNPVLGNPPFFVITESLDVYKCLYSNGGVPSTIQPSGTATNVVTLADGYRWKYMFTVSSSDVLKFVTNEWIPVHTLTVNDGSNQWLVQQAAIPGTLDRIDVVTQGTQYTTLPTVVITGDGTGAAATAVIDGGNVIGIIVTNTGSGYTHATATISGGGVAANGATVKAVISPIQGHGADPVVELGGFFVLVNSKLIFDESGSFTVDNDFRRIGIIKNPVLFDGITPATDTDYSQTVGLTFTSVSGTTFDPDETVTGNTSNATGVVMDFDATTKILRLVQTSGTFTPGETVIGANASGVLQTLAGTAASGTTTTVVLPNTASTTNDAYTGQTIKLTGGTGAGQVRKITGYVGLSRTATVSPAFGVAPSGSSTFVIAKIDSPDVAPFKGDIIYLENRRPIARASDQVEDIKIVVEF